MRTGRRCTTFTKFPVAFSAGSRASVEPVPMVKPEMRPLKRCAAAVHVHIQIHRLADAQVGELRFLEIGVDPDFRQRADGHQALPGDHVVAGIHVAPGDDAVDLGHHVAIAQIQLGLIEIALGLGQFGLGLFDGRRVHEKLGVDAIDVPLGSRL